MPSKQALGPCSWPGLAWPRDLVGLCAVDQARAPPRGLPSLGPLSSHSTRLHPPAAVYLGKGACWAWLQERPRKQPQTNQLLPQKPKLAELKSLPAPKWPDPPPPSEGQLGCWVSGWMCGGEPGSQVSGTPREATGTGAQARGLSWTPGMAAQLWSVPRSQCQTALYNLAMGTHPHFPSPRSPGRPA